MNVNIFSMRRMTTRGSMLQGCVMASAWMGRYWHGSFSHAPTLMWRREEESECQEPHCFSWSGGLMQGSISHPWVAQRENNPMYVAQLVVLVIGHDRERWRGLWMMDTC